MPNLIIENAAVQTIDTANPKAEAVVVEGNKIVFVGSHADAQSFKDANSQVIDGAGRTLMPGIHDSHFHLLYGSMGINDLRLEEVKSLEQLSDVLRQRAAEQPDTEWILGGGLAYEVVSDTESLTRHHLDEILPNRPIMVRSLDMHTAWCNTLALERAGILDGRELPAPNEILMGADGTATGQLNEDKAMALVDAIIPEPTETERLDLLRRGLAECASYGITSVTNMWGDANQFYLYHELEKRGELTCRVAVPYHFKPEMPLENIVNEAIPLRKQYASDKLFGGSVKLFIDGVIESYTSLMIEPYATRPNFLGDTLYSQERFSEIVTEADKLGFQIFTHAIGDGSVRWTLNGYEQAQKQNGRRDSRHRIEHVELLHNDDLPRFKELGVIAAMQPLHSSRPEIDYFVNWMNCVGEDRYHAGFRWRDLTDLGVPIPLGSDWPVVTMDPFLGMDWAVNRQAWGPDLRRQAFTLAETLAGYTTVAAYGEFTENKKGQLKPGMLADLVLLSQDITQIETEEIKNLKADLTVADGEIVYQKE